MAPATDRSNRRDLDQPGRPRDSRLFDRWSASYDRRQFQALTYRPIHDAMLGRLRGTSPRRILDLGCGTGMFLPRLRARFDEAHLIGVDLSPGMLARATTRRPERCVLVRADALSLPLSDASIDVVTCSESFHWYPDQAAVAAELARVLQPGGRLLIASIATMTTSGSKLLERWSGRVGPVIRAHPPGSLARILDEAGFEVVQQRRIPRLSLIPWPVLTDARRR